MTYSWKFRATYCRIPSVEKSSRGLRGFLKPAPPIQQKERANAGASSFFYYYIERDGQIFLLMIFSKDEQDEPTKDQKQMLAKLLKELREAK